MKNIWYYSKDMLSIQGHIQFMHLTVPIWAAYLQDANAFKPKRYRQYQRDCFKILKSLIAEDYQ